MGRMMNKVYLRHRWSHEVQLHRVAVAIYNALMRHVPFSAKYGLGMLFRRKKIPYSLVRKGSVVVQIGAPKDTLLSGRSRGMFFSILTGKKGRVVIIEPDSQSVSEFKSFAGRKNINNISFCTFGAWSKKTSLNIYINDKHPASNFTEGCKAYDEKRLKDFRVVRIPVDTVDSLLEGVGIGKVDLVSITTNGAERSILAGMKGTISSGLPYISLACTGKEYELMMEEFGYELMGYDDRGYTFMKTNIKGGAQIGRQNA